MFFGPITPEEKKYVLMLLSAACNMSNVRQLIVGKRVELRFCYVFGSDFRSVLPQVLTRIESMI